MHYPDDAGVLFQPGDAIVLQVHYHYEVAPTPDRSTVALETAPGTAPIRQLRIVNPLAPVEMPCDPDRRTPCATGTPRSRRTPGSTARSGRSRGRPPVPVRQDGGGGRRHVSRRPARSSCDSPVPTSGRIITVMGHMHTLGSTFRLTLDPGKANEKILLDIPHWNFDWQMNYDLATPIHVTAGDTIRMECSWDRSFDPTPAPEVRRLRGGHRGRDVLRHLCPRPRPTTGRVTPGFDRARAPGCAAVAGFTLAG